MSEPKWVVNVKKCLHSKFCHYFQVNSCPINVLSVSSLNQTKVFVFPFETLAWFRVGIKSPYRECFICLDHTCKSKTVCADVTCFELSVVLCCQADLSLKSKFDREELNLK